MKLHLLMFLAAGPVFGEATKASCKPTEYQGEECATLAKRFNSEVKEISIAALTAESSRTQGIAQLEKYVEDSLMPRETRDAARRGINALNKQIR